jgi:hypothetical protein
MPRLPKSRRPRRSRITVGTCATCGVRFVALPDRVEHTKEVLRVHALACPGGDRTGDVVQPFK